MAVPGLALAAGPAVALLFPDAASAHALQSREDLPIPPWLAFWGAALVLIVSFGVLSVAWTEPKLQEDRWRPSSDGLSRLLVNPVTQALAGLFGVLLLGVVVYSGLRGTDSPAQNFSLTFDYKADGKLHDLSFVDAGFGVDEASTIQSRSKARSS